MNIEAYETASGYVAHGANSDTEFHNCILLAKIYYIVKRDPALQKMDGSDISLSLNNCSTPGRFSQY